MISVPLVRITHYLLNFRASSMVTSSGVRGSPLTALATASSLYAATTLRSSVYFVRMVGWSKARLIYCCTDMRSGSDLVTLSYCDTMVCSPNLSVKTNLIR